MGDAGTKLDELAARLGFAKSDDLFVAVARAELSLRQLQTAVHGNAAQNVAPIAKDVSIRKSKAGNGAEKGILIVGVDKLLTQIADCCKPAPPDHIVGFVTRGKGVSIHRANC